MPFYFLLFILFYFFRQSKETLPHEFNHSAGSVLILGLVSLEFGPRLSPTVFGRVARAPFSNRGWQSGQWTTQLVYKRLIYQAFKLILASLITEKKYRLGMVCPIHRSVFSLLVSGYRVLKISVGVTDIVRFQYTRFKLKSSFKMKAKEISYKLILQHKNQSLEGTKNMVFKECETIFFN